MKVCELSGALLDYWVARANGWTFGPPHKIHEWDVWRDAAGEIVGTIPASGYTPSTDWAQAGPIIERERICLEHDGCYALIDGDRDDVTWHMEGKVILEAAMRCYVASKFGEEVPDEAVK